MNLRCEVRVSQLVCWQRQLAALVSVGHHPWGMTQPAPSIDLDAAVAEIESRRAEWASEGLEIGPFTWRDASVEWPQHLVAREAALSPDSVGFEVRRRAAEGAVVLFRGGWADIEWWLGTADSEPEIDAPAIPDVRSFGRLLDELRVGWTGSERHG